MIRNIWIVVLLTTFNGGICNTANHANYSEWLLSLSRKLFTEKAEAERSVCVTRECEELASEITKTMNRDVDPCDDFYEYACGNWAKYNPLPEDESRWNLFLITERNVEDRLKGIVEEGPKLEDFHASRIAKRAFKACIDTDQMEKVGLQPLITTLWSTGGWPLIMEEDEWNEKINMWHNVDDYYARLIGLNSFHDVRVDFMYWNINSSNLVFKGPHVPLKMFDLLDNDVTETDSSDENKDSGEGSQERGSEERENEEDGKYEDDEDLHELMKRKVSKKKINNRKTHKNRINNRMKGTRKHVGKNKLKGRTKRDTTKMNVYSKKQHERRITNRKAKRHLSTKTEKLPKHKPTSIPGSITKSARISRLKNNERKEYRNVHYSDNYSSDWYYEEGSGKDETNNEDQGENNTEGNNDENDEGNNSSNYSEYYNDYYEEGSSSGDSEWPDQDYNNSGDYEEGSSSGDYEWPNQDYNNSGDYEEGSSSGDYEWPDQDYNNSGDYEEGSSSGDYEWPDQDYNNSGDYEEGSSSGDYEWPDQDYSGSGDNSDNESGNSDDNDADESEGKKRKVLEKVRAKYAEYILNVSLALSEARGVTVSKEKLVKDIADLIEFQIKLLTAISQREDELNATLGSLQEMYDSLKPQTCNGRVNWIRKVQDIFTNGGMEIDADTNFLVSSPKYINALRELLDTTPSRTIVNYIHWNFISRIIKATTKEMRTYYANWEDKEIKEKYRANVCIEETQAQYILGYEYVKKYVPDTTVQVISDMIDDIQKEIENEVKKSPWLDDEMRHINLDKLMYMKRVIGYPKSYRNATHMKEYLKGLSITASHYDNLLSIMRYFKIEQLKIYFTNEFPIDLIANPLEVNAFYSVDNRIEITAADFQKPFFDLNQPWYTNYGIMGLILGHEVNHGFDNYGRLGDKDGNLAEWSDKMEAKYMKRLKCFIDQFTKYSVEKNGTANIQIKDYGVQTAGENIADTMGLKAVFNAYKRRLRVCETPDPMLPGLEDFSNEQLFFLSFAHLWCEVADPKILPSNLRSDPHSPGMLRVIGSVSNSEDFAKAYNCPKDSPMNPRKKCSIWK